MVDTFAIHIFNTFFFVRWQVVLIVVVDRERGGGPNGLYFYGGFQKIKKILGWRPFLSERMDTSGGSRISPEGAPTYDFAKFSQKLHEIERIWAPRGGGRTPPLDPHLVGS